MAAAWGAIAAVTAAPPSAPPPLRNYALAALVAAVTLALLLAFSPTVRGLRVVTPDRIVVMEPGEQHQARHPASANWALGFADQFRFAAETARQRAAHVAARDVSPDERQWHFQLRDAEVADGDLAVFIPNAAGTLSLHVNGAGTASGRELPHYAGPAIGQSLLAAPIAASDLVTGLNRVDILQSADRNHIGVRGIYLGPRAAVQDAAATFVDWIDGQRIAGAMAAAAGTIGALLLILIGQQRIPAAAFGLLAMTQIAVFLPSTPLLYGLALAAATMAGASAIVWCRQHPHDWIGCVLLGLAVPALGGGVASIVLLGVDVLPAQPERWLQLAGNGARPVLLVGAPLSIWRDGQRLLERIRALRAESQRKDRTIAEQQAALDAEIRHAAVLEERQRFARDMHDGIGGHLQGLLMRVRAKRIDSGAIAEELQSGLADLRLMVDSLDQVDASLYLAMENFRIRVLPQLQASGVTLDWQLDENVGEVALEPRRTLSLYRILQELVTNCIRHAGASNLAVSVSADPDRRLLEVAVRDDGCGFDALTAPTGRGVANMRARVERMGGTFTLASSPVGTRTEFSLPVTASRS